MILSPAQEAIHSERLLAHVLEVTADFNLASVERKKSLIYTRPFSDRSTRTFFARSSDNKKAGPALNFVVFLFFR